MEEVSLKLIEYINNAEYPYINFISSILTFFKNLLVNIDYILKLTTLQNLKTCLLNAMNNKTQLNLNSEAVMDVNILLSYLNTKLNNDLIHSFASHN